MYKVNNINFSSFDEVVKYAWNTLKVELTPDIDVDEQLAVEELNKIFEEKKAITALKLEIRN